MSSRLRTASLTPLHWLAVALAALTGLIHVGIGIQFGDVLLLLAGLGFFGAIVLFLLDVNRRLLYLAGVPYTGLQFVLYFVQNWPNVVSPAGILDKVVQLALVVALVVLYRRTA
jgi:hypothetical protein